MLEGQEVPQSTQVKCASTSLRLPSSTVMVTVSVAPMVGSWGLPTPLLSTVQACDVSLQEPGSPSPLGRVTLTLTAYAPERLIKVHPCVSADTMVRWPVVPVLLEPVIE
jgi:hypothetical protein